MSANQTIFVTGATGNQGGAVVRSLSHAGFNVIALTRNPDGKNAIALKKENVQVVKGDLNNPETYKSYLKGADGVFSVQSFEEGTIKEIQQGKTLADLAKENAVKHFIYSSVSNSEKNTGVPHWDSKFEIEEHIRSLQIPFTIIRPVSLFENFLIPQVKKGILKGKFDSPVNKDVMQQYIASQSIGKITVAIFSDPDKYTDKTFSVASEEMNAEETAAVFSKVLGKEVHYRKLPALITRIFMGKALSKMFAWLNTQRSFPKENIVHTQRDFPGLMTMEEWIQKHYS